MRASDDSTIPLLDAAMQRAWATAEPSLLVVRVGKPEAEHSVVEQLQASASESGGWAMSAEANVVGLDPPHGPLVRALAAFAPRIATEPGSVGSAIRHRLSQSAAPTGRLLANFCRELAPFVTDSNEPEALSFGYARERLETLLVHVFAAFAPPERPLVFFLRRADRADLATLRCLSRILAHAETRQLVVVAFVDPQDKPRHPSAWNAFSAERKYVVERFSVGVTHEGGSEGEPRSRTFTTRLPAETRHALAAAACSGQTADLEAIATAFEGSSRDVTEHLKHAIEAGLLGRHGSSYTFTDACDVQACRDAVGTRTLGRMHLLLAKCFAFDTNRKSFADSVFVSAAHLGYAVEYDAVDSCDDAERARLTGVLLDAAQRAIHQAAYDVASEYLDAAAKLLAPRGDVWSSGRLDLASRIDFARLECMCALGDRSRAEQLFESLRWHARYAPEMKVAERCLVELATRSGEHEAALELAAQALIPLGIHLEPSPNSEVVDQAFETVFKALGDRGIEEISDLEIMTNPEALEATELLFTVHPSAQALGAGPADLVACHMSRLALLHGNADASSVGHAALGAAVIGRKKDHRMGYRFGKVALSLCKQRGTNRHHSAVSMKFAATMSIWTHPLQTTIEQCARTYEIALACGDARAGNRLAAMIAFLSLLGGSSLEDVANEALKRRRAIRSHSCDDEGMGDLCDAIERFVGQQKGRPSQRKAHGSGSAKNLRLGHIACRVVDLISLVLAYEYEAAVVESAAIRASIGDVGAQILVPEYHFWSMLAATATCSSGLPEGLDEVIADFERWADRCPQTFEHKHSLLVAERCRLEGRDMDAMRAYDQAITEARDNGYTHIEAIAAETATRFYSTRDFAMIAGTYYRTARNAYGRWGASFKMVQLDRRFSKLSGTTEGTASTPPPTLRGSVDADVFTAVKAAQSVSKEIVLQRVLVTLMRIVIDHGGAERCHILLAQDDELSHSGKAATTSKGVNIEVPGPVAKSLGDVLPASMLEYVRRSHESICVDDPALDREWAEDPYIAATRPRSVVCFPIMRQSTFVGTFYLENNSARGTFTPRRLALLEFLANQASISLDHAKLYADLARENTERRRAEQVLRKSEERLRRLVEIADVIPWEVDANSGIFTFIGSQAVQRLGWPANIWRKPNFLRENVHPHDRDAAVAAFGRACAVGKHPGLDFRIIATDGHPVWLHMVIGTVDQENGQRLLSGFFFDITERKESEQLLRDKLEIIERQKDDIRTLSTPLLDVSEGVVAMPILGELDEERASRVMDILLDTITKRAIHSAILDLTGVSSIGDATAEQLGRIVRAVELVGARAIIAGIRADVARAIVSLDIGLGRIETRASMKDALRVLVKTPLSAAPTRNAAKNQSRSLR